MPSPLMTDDYDQLPTSDPLWQAARRHDAAGQYAQAYDLSLQLRHKYPSNPQLANYEHNLYAKQVESIPGKLLTGLVLAPGYTAYKGAVEHGMPDFLGAVNATTTPASFKQMMAGVRGGVSSAYDSLTNKPFAPYTPEAPPFYSQVVEESISPETRALAAIKRTQRQKFDLQNSKTRDEHGVLRPRAVAKMAQQGKSPPHPIDYQKELDQAIKETRFNQKAVSKRAQRDELPLVSSEDPKYAMNNVYKDPL